ncbi:MAG: high-potential iron-sulfur protein [Thiohalospira sp.]|uniref:high-potential iron-sulfur protein n=1 Tax=Thiohalospira sp. TaxID=3080549 RepID=UPI00397FBD89
MSSNSDFSRRKFLKAGVAVVAAAPVAALVGGGTAFAAERLKEDDPQAKSMKYVHDASESDEAGEGETCKNCALYTGDRDADWGSCSIFGGKEVNIDGWCNSWAKAD